MMQPYWMPFSPDKEFKAEPRMFARAQGQPEHGADLAEDLLRFCNLYGGENIAAVFVEPTAGSFGCLPSPKGYLNCLREICDQQGILLVFDEIITNMRAVLKGL